MAPVVQVRDLGKSFPGVRALHAVDLDLHGGEVLAVIGENGAGKSTLMKILAGVQQPNTGEIRIDGNPVSIDNARRARELGIALIHQELNLCDNLTVAANVFLGIEPVTRFRIDTRRMRTATIAILDRIGLNVDADTLVGGLSVGQQQIVEIAKALATEARVLIMDEPTSSLSQGEAERLLQLIRELRTQGVAVVYISHRLGEVDAVADRVIVLRDGEVAGQLESDQIDHDAMVRLMVGRDVDQLYCHVPRTPGSVALEIRGVRTRAFPAEIIEFSVMEGEIVGLAGLVGAGRSELLRCVFGVDSRLSGACLVAGRALPDHDPAAAIDAGLMLAPEDRKHSGLVTEHSVVDNLGLARLRRDSGRFGYVSRRGFDAVAGGLVEQLGIRTPSLNQEVRFLSGGNQQKVVLGKWLAMAPRVLLLDEPTRGIDVGAKAEIYALMDQLAARGVAVLFASSEMEEVLGMADRVFVMHEGRITGELSRAELSEEAVMRLATNHESVA